MGIRVKDLEQIIMRVLAANIVYTNPLGDGADYESIGLALAMNVKAEHFDTVLYQHSYNAFVELYAEGKPITILSLHDKIGDEIANSEVVDLFDTHPNSLNLVGLLSELLKKVWMKKTGNELFNQHTFCSNWLPFDPIDAVTDGIQEISAPPNFVPKTPTMLSDGLMINWAGKMREYLTGKKEEPIKSGFRELDTYLSGFHAGKFIVIAGLPGSGKTAFATNMALNVGCSFEPVLYITNEMDKYEIIDRMVASDSSIKFNSINQKIIDEKQKIEVLKSYDKMKNIPIAICDDSNGNWEKAEIAIRKHKKEKNLKVVFVDYLQQYSLSKKTTSRVAELSEITARIKCMAMELKITIIAMSQLNREIYGRMKTGDKRPVLADLKESGSIEQDADSVMFLMEGGETSISGTTRKRVNCYIEKNRSGEKADFELTADFSINKFYNQ